MKVFISWSGEKSKAVADLLDEWIPCVLQATDPWMSSKDIDRGSLWFSDISDALADTSVGIICLTEENKERPWILFESGALAKGLRNSKVCTLLVDLQPSDVSNPLGQFNHTLPTEEGIWNLVSTINAAMGERALPEKILEKVYSTYWPQFNDTFAAAVAKHKSAKKPAKRSDDSILADVLESVRSMEHRLRVMETPTPKVAASSRPLRRKRHRDADFHNRIYLAVKHGVPSEELIMRLVEDGYEPTHVKDSISRVQAELRSKRK